MGFENNYDASYLPFHKHHIVSVCWRVFHGLAFQMMDRYTFQLPDLM